MTNYQPRHELDPVWINGVKANDLTFVSSGVGVMIDGISGWDDSVEVRDVREPRPGFDGEDADNAYMNGRTITVSGVVAGSSWANLQVRKRTLAATFAPTAAEVLFKVPDPATAAPTTSYASTGMSGYERAWVKVVEGIAFGEVAGFTQQWQVVLRASDPRIYSDTESTDNESIASYAGTTPTPLKVVLSMAGNADVYAQAVSTTGDDALWMRATVSTTLDASAAAYTTTHDFVVDGGTREAYVQYPQNAARILMYQPTWFYRMNEAAGTTIDNAEGTAAYDGTTSGTPTLNQTGPATDMKSILFDGVNDYVSRAWDAALFPAEFTWEIWTKNVGSSGYTADYTNGTTTTGFRFADLGTYMTFEAGNGTSLVFLGTFYKSSATWTHFAATYRDGVWSCYVNGVLAVTIQSTFSEATSGTYYLGRSQGGSYWNGYISSVGVYPRAYSKSVIADMYNGGDAKSIARYRSGSVITTVNEWPTLAAAESISLGGNIGACVTTYRSARL